MTSYALVIWSYQQQGTAFLSLAFLIHIPESQQKAEKSRASYPLLGRGYPILRKTEVYWI